MAAAVEAGRHGHLAADDAAAAAHPDEGRALDEGRKVADGGSVDGTGGELGEGATLHLRGRAAEDARDAAPGALDDALGGHLEDGEGGSGEDAAQDGGLLLGARGGLGVDRGEGLGAGELLADGVESDAERAALGAGGARSGGGGRRGQGGGVGGRARVGGGVMGGGVGGGRNGEGLGDGEGTPLLCGRLAAGRRGAGRVRIVGPRRGVAPGSGARGRRLLRGPLHKGASRRGGAAPDTLRGTRDSPGVCQCGGTGYRAGLRRRVVPDKGGLCTGGLRARLARGRLVRLLFLEQRDGLLFLLLNEAQRLGELLLARREDVLRALHWRLGGGSVARGHVVSRRTEGRRRNLRRGEASVDRKRLFRAGTRAVGGAARVEVASWM